VPEQIPVEFLEAAATTRHGGEVNSEDRGPTLPSTVYPSLFGGVGQVRVSSLLHGPSAPFTAALRCELAPGGRVGAHVQQEFAELVIGVAGDGEAKVNGVVHPLSSARAVHVPLGAVLEIINRSSDVPLGYVIVKASG
jgi:quercetin dioxygenase-like cupin family protein